MRTVAVILARMDSNRLPGKGLRLMAERPMLQVLLDRLRCCPGVDAVVLATTDRPCDDPLIEWAVQTEIDVYRGDVDDVLGRFAAAATSTGADTVVKANGDNPLLAPEVTAAGLQTLHTQHLDFVTGKSAYTRLPVGLGTEIITARALRRLEHAAGDAFHREHVTAYVFENPDAFRWNPIPVPSSWQAPDVSLTVDTSEDFDSVAATVAALHGTPVEQWTPELIIATARQAHKRQEAAQEVSR